MTKKLLVSTLLALMLSVFKISAQLTAGVANTDITPPLGTPMPGYYFERLATNVHDKLYAKALLFSDGEQSTAIVILDMASADQGACEIARARISQDLDIPYDHIIISATHTHTGIQVNDSNREWMASKIYDAVKIASQSMVPVNLEYGTGKEEGLSFHRRFMMKDGTVKFNPGILNPDIVRPMGPIDPEVVILKVEQVNGKVLAVLVNFAIHLDTIGGTEISADFPAFLAEVIKTVYGPQTEVIFGLGTCGNINHINVSKEDKEEGFETAERIGYALASTVIKEDPALESAASKTLQVGHQKVELAIPQYTKEEIKQAEINAKKTSDLHASTPEIREAMKILRVQKKQGQPFQVEVQTVGLDDLAIVALPGEVFVELGLAIKKQSTFKHTMILTLSNNKLGYVPNADAFQYGAYEVEVSNIAEGEGEKLVEVATDLLQEMKPKNQSN